MSSSAAGSSRATQAGIIAALVALTTFIAWRVFDIQPFDGDNLWILAWADRAQLSDLPGVSAEVFPEWRPLSYATIWLQYRSATFEHLWVYQLVNVTAWIACAWMVSRIVLALSGSSIAAIVGAVVFLTSTQLVSSFILIVERQTSMACFFGLTAWLVVIRTWDDQAARWRWVWISVLLVASALSKEFGLAFTAAVGVFALLERRRPAMWAAASAGTLYAASRLVLADGAIAPYCEQHGYFFSARNVCFDGLTGPAISQGLYNIVATGIGSFLPGIFFDDGRIDISPRWLIMSGGLLAIALIGWARGPRLTRIGLLVVALNAVMSFLLYRSRNHAVAVSALSVAIGVGVPTAWSAFGRVQPSRLAHITAVAICVSALATRAIVMRTLVSDRVEMSKHPDACGPDIPDLSRAFMARLWRLYNLELPECAGDASNP